MKINTRQTQALLACAAVSSMVVIGVSVFELMTLPAEAQRLYQDVTISGPMMHANSNMAPYYRMNSDGTVSIVSPSLQTQTPRDAIYHQVTDKWFDVNGSTVKTNSATHLVDAYCQPGVRRPPEEVIAVDDGKGNVRFTPMLLASEPTTGVKPITAEGIVKAKLAANRSPHIVMKFRQKLKQSPT